MVMEKKKQTLLNALAKKVNELRGEKSQFLVASENDISVSIISTVERGLKDPQFTTLYKLAEALNLRPHELVKLIEDDLPKGFTLIDK